ncbi:MAG: DUF2279 domain-containing protein [Bacteroidota bacterium]|jgi:hypothetical protein
MLFLLHGTYNTAFSSVSETDTTTKRSRLAYTSCGMGIAYAASMSGLYTLWYQDYPREDFHFFNDNAEWLQMDKLGHVGSAYYLSNWSSSLFKWSGVKHKQAAWLGSASSLAFLTTIEMFDGFSTQWGFSNGDMLANFGGAGLSLVQNLKWNEQRIKIKFSFSSTRYATYRPDQLGKSNVEQLFKDYNGQTYWVSGNIHAFMRSNSKFPKWLNLALGYGVDGLTGARTNITGTEDFNRLRQYYLALDVDLTRIPTRSKFLKTVFETFGFIKIPSPAIEFRSNGTIKGHGFYF